MYEIKHYLLSWTFGGQRYISTIIPETRYNTDSGIYGAYNMLKIMWFNGYLKIYLDKGKVLHWS